MINSTIIGVSGVATMAMLTTMAIPVTIGIMVSLTLLFGIAGIIS
jgi:hypothetical protein